MANHSNILASRMHEKAKKYEKAKRYDTGRWVPSTEGVQYATKEEYRAITNSSRKNEVAGPKQKQRSVVDVSGGESKVRCCEKISHRNLECSYEHWSMNQGKLEVVKQEMARVDIDILGLSELKWTRMGEFNSDDHYIYYCGQEFLRRNGVDFLVNKRVWNAVFGCNLKINRMISVHFQGKPFK